MEHYSGQCFDFLAWRRGSVEEILKIPHREKIIIYNRRIIRKYAIGYCKAENIPCKPKTNNIAVMFNTGGENWWSHLTIKEFEECFPELKI